MNVEYLARECWYA